MTIHVFRGLPGSGKSTEAKKWVQAYPDVVRVNRDDIRVALGITGGIGTPQMEEIVTKMENAAITAAVANGRDVIVDATNLNNRFVKRFFEMGKVRFVDFDMPVSECVKRDAMRVKTVGESVIRGMAKRAKVGGDGKLPEPPSKPEHAGYEHKPYVRGGVPAYSFDIDGTLARMGSRSPYDSSRYMEDMPDDAIAEIFYSLARNEKVIGLTGRSEDHREVTERWLKWWGFRLDALFMRPSGDNRNDSIVKSEMVDKHVSNVYNVIAHFDDRNRVVDALRAKGMKVLQVEPGDF